MATIDDDDFEALNDDDSEFEAGSGDDEGCPQLSDLA